MKDNLLKNFITQLYPTTWIEIQEFALNYCWKNICKRNLTNSFISIIYPSVPGISIHFNANTTDKLFLREISAGNSWLDVPSLVIPAEVAVLPLTFIYSWETENLWSWIVANCRADALIIAILPNLSYFPLLLSLSRGHNPVYACGIYGPVKDSHQWKNYFATKGCLNVAIEWIPVACFLKNQTEKLDDKLLLSPCYILKMFLPKTNKNHLFGAVIA